jgi:hypothetical protein
LEAAKDGSVAGTGVAAGLEDCLWLCPIEDLRGLDSNREGKVQGFSLGNYVQLVDHIGRLFRFLVFSTFVLSRSAGSRQ